MLYGSRRLCVCACVRGGVEAGGDMFFGNLEQRGLEQRGDMLVWRH